MIFVSCSRPKTFYVRSVLAENLPRIVPVPILFLLIGIVVSITTSALVSGSSSRKPDLPCYELVLRCAFVVEEVVAKHSKSTFPHIKQPEAPCSEND